MSRQGQCEWSNGSSSGDFDGINTPTVSEFEVSFPEVLNSTESSQQTEASTDIYKHKPVSISQILKVSL